MGRGSTATRRTEIRPRTKNAVAKIHHARRMRRSGVSVGRDGELGGCVTSGIEDGGPDDSRPSRRVVLLAAAAPSTFVPGRPIHARGAQAAGDSPATVKVGAVTLATAASLPPSCLTR